MLPSSMIISKFFSKIDKEMGTVLGCRCHMSPLFPSNPYGDGHACEKIIKFIGDTNV